MYGREREKEKKRQGVWGCVFACVCVEFDTFEHYQVTTEYLCMCRVRVLGFRV